MWQPAHVSPGYCLSDAKEKSQAKAHPRTMVAENRLNRAPRLGEGAELAPLAVFFSSSFHAALVLLLPSALGGCLPMCQAVGLDRTRKKRLYRSAKTPNKGISLSASQAMKSTPSWPSPVMLTRGFLRRSQSCFHFALAATSNQNRRFSPRVHYSGQGTRVLQTTLHASEEKLKLR